MTGQSGTNVELDHELSIFGVRVRITRRHCFLLLVLLTELTYFKVYECKFLDFDDDAYIWLNPAVQDGLTWKGVIFAFKAGLFLKSPHADYWQPCTMLSHMLVSQFFDLEPSVHHLVNLAIHALNAILVFQILLKLTRSLPQSLVVAALFAVHPLKVQSIAWVTERKDVLCATFFLLSVLAYLRYGVERTRRNWYIVLVFFLLGMMSKPIMMTLPGVLLLFDFWPLKRAKLECSAWKEWWRLLYEKKFIFITSALMFVGPFVWVKTEIVNVQSPTGWVSSVLHKFAFQFYKMLCPWVSIFYAPDPLPLEGDVRVFICGLILIFVLVYVVAHRHEQPLLFVGTFWFLGVMSPVALTHIHPEDRHLYIPSVGFCIMAVCLFNRFIDWVRSQGRLKISDECVAALFAMVVLIYASAAFSQVRFWKDSKSVYLHTLEVTPENWHFLNNLGVVYMKEDDYSSALTCFLRSVRVCSLEQPRRFPEYNLLQSLHYQTKSFEKVASFIKTSDLKIKTDDYLKIMLLKHIDLLQQTDDLSRAETECELMLKLFPDNLNAKMDDAVILYRQGRFEESLERFRTLLSHHSELLDVRNKLAWILAASDQSNAKHAPEACQLASDLCKETNYEHALIMDTLAVSYAANGQFENAIVIGETARDLATKQGDAEILKTVQRHLRLFEKKEPVYSQGQQLPNRNGFRFTIEPL